MKMAVAIAVLAFGTVTNEIPKSPGEAVAIANARLGHGTKGIFRMTVAAAAREGKIVYLNSSTDYRAPDDLTFQLTSSAAKALEKRLGGKPEVALLGKSVTVRGTVEAVKIFNLSGHRVVSFNRYQHRVLVYKADQIVID